jgi:hypothetical protein
MKIPIFEEILLKGISINDLQNIVEDSRIGKVPCYVNLSNYSAGDLETLIINLEHVILTNSLHPRFPYPFYIIATKAVRTIFPSVRSVKDLPEHYFKKIKRPNNKELQLLNKLSLKVDKIKNLELYKISQQLKDSADSQKILYVETKELYFLETLNDALYAKPKTKSR